MKILNKLNDEILIRKMGVVLLLIVIGAATIISIFAPVASALNENMTITSDTGSLHVGIPQDVKFTVTSTTCTPQPDGTCPQVITYVSGASVQLSGAASGSGTTGTDGTVTLNINANAPGNVTATASINGSSASTVIKAWALPQLKITADTNSVYIGTPRDVKFTVTENCPQGTDACTQGSLVPGASVQLSGAGISTGGTTDKNGTWTVSINASSNGTITATASKAGYTDGSTTISADYHSLATVTVEKTVYRRREPVNFTLTNTGPVDIEPDLWLVRNASGSLLPVYEKFFDNNITLTQGQSITVSWNQTNKDGKLVPPGVYVAKMGWTPQNNINNSYAAFTDQFEITSCSAPVTFPPKIVNSTVGNGETFKTGNLTSTGKTWNVTWYINGTQVDRQTGITQVSSYTNTNAAVGVWNVTAVADSGCDTYTFTFIWTVNPEVCTNTVYEPKPYNSTVGKDITFESGNLTGTKRTWNVTWYINGTQVDRQTGITQVSFYTNRSAAPGVWNVTAVADSGCSTITWTIIWTVKPAPPGCFNTVNDPKSYASYAGDEITFKSGDLSNVNKTWDRKWNFTWYLNGNPVYNETGVNQSSMKMAGALGVWNLTVIADHDCSKVSWKWVWTVTQKPSPPPGDGGGGGSSSGGGGGGGITTAEPYTNILKFERQDADLKRSTPVAYSFSTPEFSIYQVLVTGKESEGQVGMRLEHLKATSALVNKVPPGTIYANENVWLASKKVDSVLIRFRVSNSWIANNNLAKEDIRLLRFDSVWKKLNAKVINSDDSYTYYESLSSGLSSFAVSGLTGQVQELQSQSMQGENVSGTDASQQDSDANSTGTPKGSPGFEIAAGIGIVLAAYILIWTGRRK